MTTQIKMYWFCREKHWLSNPLASWSEGILLLRHCQMCLPTPGLYRVQTSRLELIFLREDRNNLCPGVWWPYHALISQINYWFWLFIAPQHHFTHILWAPRFRGHKRDKEGSTLKEIKDWNRQIHSYKPVSNSGTWNMQPWHEVGLTQFESRRCKMIS